MSETQTHHHQLSIPDEHAGQRLDKVLSALFPDFSRSRLQQWLKDGCITLDGQVLPGKHKVDGGELLRADFPEQEDLSGAVEAQDIPLVVLYEDDDILVVDKPAGMVVHPAAGNPDGTLQNALLFYAPELAGVPRSGIVHRLDKDTSGLLVVARNHSAHQSLVAQLQERSVSRIYEAIVFGVPVSGGRVEGNIGRHPGDRKKMAVRQVGGKEAVTHYRVEAKYRHHSHVRCQLETGRTHQIRVHMSHIGFPLVGDPVYGGRLRLPGDIEDSLLACLKRFDRQALHAAELGLIHPRSGEAMRWESPMPEDMDELLFELENDAGDIPQAEEAEGDADDWDDWDEDDYDVEVIYTDE
ncbi:ribosomal large subunit pseudouridine synthase D [gamma proteobacterium HTCC5015]|nr:ribosomal large subunit pseudouridine synthase D [gamma proteobacterium HTCC5015]